MIESGFRSLTRGQKSVDWGILGITFFATAASLAAEIHYEQIDHRDFANACLLFLVGIGATALVANLQLVQNQLDAEHAIEPLFTRIWAAPGRIVFNGVVDPPRHIIGAGKYASENSYGKKNTELPEPRTPPLSPADTATKWTITHSVLRCKCLQDLLFDDRYLRHLARGLGTSDKDQRLLVIDPQVRDGIAIRAYLSLSNALNIDTYLATKREYAAFLKGIPKVLPSKAMSSNVQQIMRGNPELSRLGGFSTAVKHSDRRTLLLRDEKHLDPGITNIASSPYTIAELAAVNLFLVSVGGHTGSGKSPRLFEKEKPDGDDVLAKLMRGSASDDMDLLHLERLREGWDKTVRELHL